MTFAVLGTGATAYPLLQSLVIPAIPAFEHSLHTSATGASWVLTSFLLSSAVMTPIVGRLGDKAGKKRVLVAVLVAMAIGTLISGVATTLPIMLAGRVIQGVGGAIFPLTFAIIRDEFPRDRVASAIGMMSSILGIGGGAGIVLAGPIIDHLSYHWIFWFPLAMTAIAAICTHVVVPESPVRNAGGINWAGGVAMSAGLVTLLLAVAEGPTWGWGNRSTVLLFVAAAVASVLWVVLERRSDAPLVDMVMMKIPTVWRTNLAGTLLGFGMFAIFIILPNFVEAPRNTGYGLAASVTMSGVFLVPVPLAMLFVAPFTGRLTHRFGSKPILAAGAIIGALSYALIAIWHGSTLPLYLGTSLFGIAVALGYASMTNLIVDAVPATQTGVATGMNTNVRNIGGALGAGIATSIIFSSHGRGGLPLEKGYTMALVVCAIALGIAAVAALIVPGRPARDHAVRDPSHPGLLAEAEVFVGSIAVGPEDLA
jgi:EmrB/QacA subfamily drug resistance transporter